jgi:hypothetical protein
MLRTLLISLVCLTLASCQRELPDGAAPARGTAMHPWQAQGRELPFAPQPRPPAEAEQSVEEVPAKLRRGPAFTPGDTIDASLLPGTYLQVCQVKEEKMREVPVNYQDVVTLEKGGHLIYKNVDDWKEEVLEGDWRKPEPGKLLLNLGPNSPELSAEMYDGTFLYLWSYDAKVGYWWAKVPDQFTEHIGYNSFSTSRGVISLKDVVSSSFTGTVTGLRPLRISGFYQRGVIVARWEEEDKSGGGYAAFIAGPDWKSLRGAWWIDDYEAAPFGGEWNGTAD